MPPKRTKAPAAAENVSLGPQVREGSATPDQQITYALRTRLTFTGELVFGVARIFASFNDTFVHVTDLRFVSI